MRLITLLMMLGLVLAACGWSVTLPPPVTPNVPPSSTPNILSPTPAITIPSPFLTESAAVSLTPAALSSTLTPTSFPALTPSPSPTPGLTTLITGCNTSLDLTHQMGEVTNAYVTVSNPGARDLTNVCATLSASDEARVHPDKTHCIALLPAGDQVILKLTVDTGHKQDTAIQVEIVTSEGLSATDFAESCRDIGLPGLGSDEIGVVHPIP